VCSGSSCCVCGCYNRSTWLLLCLYFVFLQAVPVWVLWLFVMFIALFSYHLCTWSVPNHISEQAECWCCTQWLTIARSKGSTRLGASLPKDGSRSSFWIVTFFKISYEWQSPKKKKRLCQWENHVQNNKIWLGRLPFHFLTKPSMLLMHTVQEWNFRLANKMLLLYTWFSQSLYKYKHLMMATLKEFCQRWVATNGFLSLYLHIILQHDA